MSIVLFVGDNNKELSDLAKNYNPTAFLIDHNNYIKFLNSSYTNDICAYTSPSDLPKILDSAPIFFQILSKADKIFYCPPKRWSDHNANSHLSKQQTLVEYYLYNINYFKTNVVGLDLFKYNYSNYLMQPETRHSDSPSLWIAGCSVAHGTGVEKDQRFGALIAKKLEMPEHYLTGPGRSIEWAADQILRADIRPNDIVVWAITSECRTVKAQHGMVIHETDPDILLDETRLYHAVTKIHQVANFCKKSFTRLLLLPLLCSESVHLMIHYLDSYCTVPYRHPYLDVGTDGLHPGPMQHKEWADYCINHVKTKYETNSS